MGRWSKGAGVLVRWLVWSAAALALWIVLTVAFTGQQLVAGAIVALLAGGLAEAVRHQARLRFAWRAFPLGALPRQLGLIVVDSARLAGVLWRVLVRRRPVRGRLAVATVRTLDDDARAAALHAGAIYLGSLSPNTFVIGIDPDEELVLFHQLVPTGGAPPGAGPREQR
jgi:multisubunit Na+/H+ antiporter MnhE subunit